METEIDQIFVGERQQFTGLDSRFIVTVSNRSIAIIAYRGNFYAVDNVCYLHGCPLVIGDVEEIHGMPFLLCPWNRHLISLEPEKGVTERVAGLHSASISEEASRSKEHVENSRSFFQQGALCESMPYRNDRLGLQQDHPHPPDQYMATGASLFESGSSEIGGPPEFKQCVHRVVVDDKNIKLLLNNDNKGCRNETYMKGKYDTALYNIPCMVTPMEKAMLLSKCSVGGSAMRSISQLSNNPDGSRLLPFFPYSTPLSASRSSKKTCESPTHPYKNAGVTSSLGQSSLQKRKTTTGCVTSGSTSESHRKKSSVHDENNLFGVEKTSLIKDNNSTETKSLAVLRRKGDGVENTKTTCGLVPHCPPISVEECDRKAFYCAQAGVNPLRYGSNPFTSSSGDPFFSNVYFSVYEMRKVCKGTRELVLRPYSGCMRRTLEYGEIIMVQLPYGAKEWVSLVVMGRLGDHDISTLVRLPEKIVTTAADGTIINSVVIDKNMTGDSGEDENEQTRSRDADGKIIFQNEKEIKDSEDELLLTTEYIAAPSAVTSKRKSLQHVFSSLIYPKSKLSFLYRLPLLSSLLLVSFSGSFTLTYHMDLINACNGRVLWISAGLGVCSAYASMHIFFCDPVVLPHRFREQCNDNLTVVHIHAERERRRIPKLHVFEEWEDHFSPLLRRGSPRSISPGIQHANWFTDPSTATETGSSARSCCSPSNTLSYVFHAFLTKETETGMEHSQQKSKQDIFKSFQTFSRKPFSLSTQSRSTSALPHSNLDIPSFSLPLPRFTYGRLPEHQDIRQVLNTYFEMRPTVVFLSGTRLFIEKYIKILKQLNVKDDYIIPSPKVEGM